MDRPFDVLVTGADGQLGRALARADWPSGVGLQLKDRAALDITDAGAIAEALADRRIGAVINAAAFTAVDRAETEAGAAFAVNAIGPGLLADAAHAAGVPLLHISTDFVFHGEEGRSYREDDAPRPVNVYGASKLAGELAVLGAAPRSIVLRSAWLFSGHGMNFLNRMLALAVDRPSIRVVNDLYGSPTCADDLARACVAVIARWRDDADPPFGLYHFANAGDASWADLALEILAGSALTGGPTARVVGIAARDYPTAAPRPRDTRLSCARLTADYGIVGRPWRDAVRDVIRLGSNRERAA